MSSSTETGGSRASSHDRGRGRGRGAPTHTGTWQPNSNAASVSGLHSGSTPSLSRGIGHGRGRGRGGIPRGGPKLREKTRYITENIGGLVEVISLGAQDEFPVATVQNVVSVASYDWLDRPTPTMAVPGSPRVWVDTQPPFKCAQDSKIQYIDQSAYRCPKSPLTPLIACVQHWNPTFDLSQVEIVTDRNGLRKLLKWAMKAKDEFRIDIQRAGSDTVLFTRWQAKTRALPDPTYGHEFERVTTTGVTGLLPTEGHHRVITYEYGGLKLLVRFEVDACYPSEPDPTSTVDDLISRTSGLSMTYIDWRRDDRSGSSLVQQENMIELTTRSTKGWANFKWPDKYAQVYLSGTPTLIAAVHDDGLFHTVHKFGVADEKVRRVTESMQAGLNKLGAVLHAIRDSVLRLTDADKSGVRRGRLLSLIHRDGKLALYERGGDRKLPDELLKAFDSDA